MSRSEMPDVIVLLPGITGSMLRKNGELVWGFGAKSLARTLFTLGGNLSKNLKLASDPRDVDDLGDGITADKLVPDLHMLPGFWKIDGYSKVAEQIRARFQVTEGENFFELPYDWRRDNRVSARKLARAAHGWLASWRQKKNPDAKLILVAHSMGGLVSRYFLEVLEGWKDTRALVTFGTPYRGSVNALDTLVNGMKKAGGMIDLSDMARSFTAIYQLLPTYKCYDGGDGKLVRIAEASIPNVDAAMARDALAFHDEIREAVDTHLNKPAYESDRYRVYPIVGIEQPTNQSARRAGNGVEILDTFEGKDYRGDGTVPRVSATPLEYSDEHNEMFAATRHGSLQNADAALTHLDGLIQSFYFDLGDFRAPASRAVKVALALDDLVWADGPVEIRARPEDDVALEARVVSSDSGDTVADLTFDRADGDWKVASFDRPPEGAYRVQVSGPNVEPAEDSFAVFGGDS